MDAAEFANFVKEYLDSALSLGRALRMERMLHEELRKNPALVPVLLEVGAPYIRASKNWSDLSLRHHLVVGNPLMNAFGFGNKFIRDVLRKNKEYVKVMIESLNKMPWPPEEGESCIYQYLVDFKKPEEVKEEIVEKKGFIFKRNIERIVKKTALVFKTKEEVMRDLAALL